MKKTIVVVLYNIKADDSKTYKTLKKTLLGKKEFETDFELILYDNSPASQQPNFGPQQNIHYFHDSRNLGIATAYNYAWDLARNNGSEWLILFDHDTEVTDDYIDKIMDVGTLDKSIAAVVPIVEDNGTTISPVFSGSLRPLKNEAPSPGMQEKPIMAINSGSLVHMDFLNRVGGFNRDFPLDYLDHWIFHTIYEKGYKVLVLETILQHELSVMDYSSVSLKRYKSILDSETTFYKKYNKAMLRAYKKQLAKRFIKQILLVKNKKIAFYTLRRLMSL